MRLEITKTNQKHKTGYRMSYRSLIGARAEVSVVVINWTQQIGVVHTRGV
jgi:hypothetical protein